MNKLNDVQNINKPLKKQYWNFLTIFDNESKQDEEGDMFK